MCLAIPGQIVEFQQGEPPFTTATVEFAGVRRQVAMDCVPEARPGDYVLVHAGIAISRIDHDEALRVLETLDELSKAGEEHFTLPENETPDA